MDKIVAEINYRGALERIAERNRQDITSQKILDAVNFFIGGEYTLAEMQNSEEWTTTTINFNPPTWGPDDLEEMTDD